MKFFIPHAKDDEEAEAVWRGIKTFAEQETAWPVTDSRIYRLEYVHKGQRWVALVGQPHYGEPVMAILESATYLVCTPNRGAMRGKPVLVGKSEVRAIEFFDPSPTSPSPLPVSGDSRPADRGFPGAAGSSPGPGAR